jgi:hypothetical protein
MVFGQRKDAFGEMAENDLTRHLPKPRTATLRIGVASAATPYARG